MPTNGPEGTPPSSGDPSLVTDAGRDAERVGRLLALPPADREALVRTVGEAAIDLWTMGISWTDLVDRCLEAAEEDVAAGRVPVRAHDDAPGSAAT